MRKVENARLLALGELRVQLTAPHPAAEGLQAETGAGCGAQDSGVAPPPRSPRPSGHSCGAPQGLLLPPFLLSAGLPRGLAFPLLPSLLVALVTISLGGGFGEVLSYKADTAALVIRVVKGVE